VKAIGRRRLCAPGGGSWRYLGMPEARLGGAGDAAGLGQEIEERRLFLVVRTLSQASRHILDTIKIYKNP